MRRIYSKELLEPLVMRCTSVAGVMEEMGFRHLNGGAHNHITKRIAQLNLDTTHFKGRSGNRGPSHRGGAGIKMADAILVLRESGFRTKAYQLRRALLERGREYKCGGCGMLPVWNGKPMTLEVEHRDGNFLNDQEENLEFLCPNCHSQTSTYCRSKGKATLTGLKYAPLVERQTHCA